MEIFKETCQPGWFHSDAQSMHEIECLCNAANPCIDEYSFYNNVTMLTNLPANDTKLVDGCNCEEKRLSLTFKNAIIQPITAR